GSSLYPRGSRRDPRSFPTRRSSDLGVAPAVAVKDLFARECDLHRAACDHRELGRRDLVTEGIAFSAEAAPVGTSDHADAGRRKLDRKSTRLNSSHVAIPYADFCLKT